MPATIVEPGLRLRARRRQEVSAIEVNHGEKIKPAFGYVIEFDGKKVVLSGDTKPDPRVEKAAEGADLLIHEVAVIDPKLLTDYPNYRAIENHHTSPEEAGKIFCRGEAETRGLLPHRCSRPCRRSRMYRRRR